MSPRASDFVSGGGARRIWLVLLNLRVEKRTVHFGIGFFGAGEAVPGAGTSSEAGIRGLEAMESGHPSIRRCEAGISRGTSCATQLVSGPAVSNASAKDLAVSQKLGGALRQWLRTWR